MTRWQRIGFVALVTLGLTLAAGTAYIALRDPMPVAMSSASLAEVSVASRPAAAASPTGGENGDASGITAHIAIGTGLVTGIFYPVGGAICRVANESDAGLRCAVESTGGSLSNLRAVRDGTLDFAFAQSDWQFQAFTGGPPFSEEAGFEKLRSVFSIYGEPLSIAVTAASAARSVADLKGLRVNIGPEGTPLRTMMAVLFEALGWSRADFDSLAEIPEGVQANALCTGAIDAAVYIGGHPNGAVRAQTEACATRLLPIEGAPVEKLLEGRPYLGRALIPGGLYAGNPDPVASFGLGATLVTSVQTDEALVYALVRALFEDFEGFRAQHPALRTLDPQAMSRRFLTAPLHAGAKRYFAERGWL